MTTATLAYAEPQRSLASRVVTAGALVGVLDISSAIALYVGIMHVTTATHLLQGIAGAFLGKASYEGGLPTAAMGLAMHFGIAMGWAVTYGIAYSMLPVLRRATATTGGALAVGGLYGVFIFLMMNLVLVPMTRAKPGVPYTTGWWAQLGIHIVIIGMTFAYLIRNND